MSFLFSVPKLKMPDNYNWEAFGQDIEGKKM